MGNKHDENGCLQKVLKYNALSGNFANGIYQILKSSNVENSERPDFILSSDECLIGLEHCMVDSLYNEQRDSYTRRYTKDIQGIVDKYEKTQDLDEGVEATVDVLQRGFDAANRFEYQVFEGNFAKICMQHNDKCKFDQGAYPSYRKKLEGYAQKSIIGCLIEIPLSDTQNMYFLRERGKTHRQCIKGFPFTKGILRLIGRMDGFDFVIVCAYSTKLTKVYYFDTNNPVESAKEQGIKIYDSFDYYHKHKVNNIDVQRNEDSYTLMFRGRY